MSEKYISMLQNAIEVGSTCKLVYGKTWRGFKQTKNIIEDDALQQIVILLQTCSRETM